MSKRKSSSSSSPEISLSALILSGIAYGTWQTWNTSGTDIHIAIVASFVALIVFTAYLLVRKQRIKSERQAKDAADERWRLSALSLIHLTPEQFEEEVAWAFGVNIDWCTAKRIGGMGDGGVDVLMLDSNGKVRGIVQCKHRQDPNTSIDPSVIRDMDSTRHRRNAEHAFVVTNARFSAASEAMSRDYNIHLVDGRRFEQFRRKAYGKFYSQQTVVSPEDFPTVVLTGQPTVPDPPALNQRPSQAAQLAQPRIAQTYQKPINTLDSIDQQLAERRARLQSK